MKQIIQDQLAYQINPKRKIVRIDFVLHENTATATFYAFLHGTRETPFFTRIYEPEDHFSFAQVEENLKSTGWTVHTWNTLHQSGARAWHGTPWVIRDRETIQDIRQKLTITGEAPQRYSLDLCYDFIGTI